MPRQATRTRTRGPSLVRAFLFSDLRDYTPFVEAHGDRAAAELLRDYRALVRREVGRHRGAEVKTEGDSFYVVFESPSAALECAVAIQRRVGEGVRKADAPLRIGIGLHAGESVAFDDQFVGSAVNIASRLAAKARTGEVVVSDTLRGLVRTAHSYRMDDRGTLRLKGVTERVRAWTVHWREEAPPSREAALAVASAAQVAKESAATPLRQPAPPPGQLVCPDVVGRDDELARVAALLDHARDGRGQTVLVAGEAGVGKSAYTRRVIDMASERGFRTLYGATLESDGGLPYSPFVTAIRSGFRGVPHERLGRVLAQAAPDLAQLFPELGRRAQGTAAEHQRLSVAFHGLFRTFAAESPILLVLEDLHWCDESSHQLLHYLARELRDSRVLVLATYRSDELHRRHPLLRALAGMQRERLVSEIALARLSKDDVQELIRRVFAVAQPDVTVSPEFRDALYERSEGNPFFTEELLRSLVDSGDVHLTTETGWERSKPVSQLRIPSSVREAVRLRTERLSPEAQATLSAAAVLGLRFGFELLRTVRGIAEGELEAHVRALIDEQLVVELETPDEYAFRHALTREVADDDLLARERRRLHRAVADALAATRGAEPALVAHHLLAAGEESAALPHLLVAAERALRADAPREAAGHFERAIAIGLDEERQAATMERLAEAYDLFDFTLARKTAEEAARLFRKLGDARGLSRMLRLASRNVREQGDSDRAVAIAQEAIAALDGLEETAELGRALAHLALLKMVSRADAEAIALADRALTLGERFSDAWTRANAMITKGVSLAHIAAREPSRKAEARELLHRGRALAIEEGLTVTALRGYTNEIASQTRLDLDPREVDRLLEEGIDYAGRHGLEQPIILSFRASTAWARGRWDEALAAAARVAPTSFWYGQALWVRAFIATGRDGPRAGIALFRDFVGEAARQEDVQRSTTPVVVMFTLAVLADDGPAASEWFGRLEDHARANPRVYRLVVDYLAWSVVLCAAYLGRTVLADPFAEDLAAASSPVTTAARDAWDALRARDQAALARCVDALRAYGEEHSTEFLPQTLILAARTARAAGLVPGPEWRPSIRRARETAERTEARWFFVELDAIERAIKE